MPAYHSDFNKDTNARMLGTIPLLAIKGKSRGVAPPAADDADDIIDEAINTFRANTFFKNYDIKGGADRILIYLTLYIQECLLKLSAKNPVPVEGGKMLQTLAVQSFPLPGDAAFPLNSMFERPANRQDADTLRAYLTQLRQEMGNRLMDRVYENGSLSKWWTCFAKRKFMGMSGTGTYA